MPCPECGGKHNSCGLILLDGGAASLPEVDQEGGVAALTQALASSPTDLFTSHPELDTKLVLD